MSPKLDSSCCKICLIAGRTLVPLDTDVFDGITVAQMLVSLHPNILLPENFSWLCPSQQPMKICTRCRPRLELAYELQQQVITSDQQLKEHLNIQLETYTNEDSLIHEVLVKREDEADTSLFEARENELPTVLVTIKNNELIVNNYGEDGGHFYEDTVERNNDTNGEEKHSIEVTYPPSHERLIKKSKAEEPSHSSLAICEYCSQSFNYKEISKHTFNCLRALRKQEAHDQLYESADNFRLGYHPYEPCRVIFHCRECAKIFGTPAEARQHTHKKVAETTCTACGKTYKGKQNFERHMRLHDETKNYPCELCGKMFKSSHNMRTHMKRHLDIKPFACNFCDYRFVVKGDLIKHLRTHTREKPFKCDLCDKAFAVSAVLSLHKRIHTGVMQYGCEICEKRFHTKSQLTVS